jgi:hypothetical protein
MTSMAWKAYRTRQALGHNNRVVLNNPAVILEESIGQTGLKANPASCLLAWRIFNQKILSE